MAVNDDMLVDKEKALFRFDNDEELLQEIFDVFVDEAPGRVQDLLTSMQEQNFEQLNHHAHSLKGVSATIHADKLKNVSFSLETAAKDENITECEHLLPIVLDALIDVVLWLERNM
ncbi:Hpt domain-containing protein [Desulfovibrio inopinatus]|uniref:Hpt domain-containing protein n=1 Tax=Desulfovibrio inopinatus TaxID=102109 RepID=UPI000413CB49|nr:Hpt domain-containing protein [Desulfovibrio inopinatus]